VRVVEGNNQVEGERLGWQRYAEVEIQQEEMVQDGVEEDGRI
jgi:hypothetical protein